MSNDRIHLDPRTLRGLAHPLRVRILTLLRDNGPSTATLLAQRLGLSSAATSYHLRQLSLYGFVADEPEQGTGRERWWHAVHRGTTVDRVDPESFGDFEIYLRAIAAEYAARMDRAISEMPTRPAPWAHVGTLSSWTRQLDPAETQAMLAELTEVIDRYRLADPDVADPEGTTRVHVQLQVLPVFDEVQPVIDEVQP
ncbi:ArsR/SmtB family transcription factor [Catellatospora tritici]|uniref:ArsR/SmtB family transcription factor n=1 Tax=Catellatospora tritici TaxID=2851566 RepID=UPI001C2D0D39|nr:helix-turn-helix domain-containing protein [Catellatospora tritici]MBV1854769.1 helix-turn-helix domain-containing protein [Catellatospora tritici]